MEPTPGLVIANKLELERPVGRGGMGAVWLGRHLTLDVPVAVKFMKSPESGAAIARTRFEREAKAAARLPSPHIVRILDYGFEDETPYIVMEYLEGEDLQDRLVRIGPLAIGEASSIIAQIAKGLRLAHDAGIVHRDLKPSNVFLARVGDEEVVKILDFGVAKDTSETRAGDATTSGLLLGSPSFMSPEQIRGQALDARSDLWSLGVIAYVALTGRRPFSAEHVGDLLLRICTEEITKPSTIAPSLGRDVDAFFQRALCRSPDGRFKSAQAFADAFAELARARPHVSGSPASALPPRVEETVSIGVVGELTEPMPQPRRRRKAIVAVFVIAIPLAAFAAFTMRSRATREIVERPAISAPAPPLESAAPVGASVEPAPVAPVVPSAKPAPEQPVRTSRARASASASARPSKVDAKFGLPVNR